MFYTVPFRDKEFKITSVSAANVQWLMNSFHFEHELREKWWQIKEGDTVVDVGAAYGSYTLSALAAGAATVVAFEPGREEMFDLCTNLFVNGWSGKASVINALVGSSNGVRSYFPGSHSYRPEGQEEQRLIVRLDDTVAALSKIDWIKIDVEGAEVEVLQGSLEILKKHQPKLFIENHTMFVPGIDEQVRNLLKPLGYIEQNVQGQAGSNENWSLWACQ